MARVATLFSSSKGNSVYVGTASAGVLIDAGASYKKIVMGLELCGLSIDAVKAVFVTHEHSDHVTGLKMLQKQRHLPIYASNGTLEYLIHNDLLYCDNELYAVNKPVVAAGMEIKAFKTPHDSVESVGYTINTEDERKISVCTDLGEVTDTVRDNIISSDLCVLEANYDEKMLADNMLYPPYLKKRIASIKGHLSNCASAVMARELIESGTTRIILGHLSQNNNRPEKAMERVLKELTDYRIGKDYLMTVAPVATVGEAIAL